MTGAPIRGDGRADLVVVSQVERHAAVLSLVRTGGGRLDDEREAELSCGRDRLLDACRIALRNERHAVGLEQSACAVRAEPEVICAVELAFHQPARSGGVDCCEVGNDSRRLA